MALPPGSSQTNFLFQRREMGFKVFASMSGTNGRCAFVRFWRNDIKGNLQSRSHGSPFSPAKKWRGGSCQQPALSPRQGVWIPGRGKARTKAGPIPGHVSAKGFELSISKQLGLSINKKQIGSKKSEKSKLRGNFKE